MKFDNILSEIDGFGKFQIKLFFILFLSRISLPCHFLLNNFMAAVPSHHCNISALDNDGAFFNLTLEKKLAVGIPLEPDGTPSSCMMYSKPDYQHLTDGKSSEDASIIQCQNGWVFDNSTFKSTLAAEWDLVCSKKAMNKATGTVFFIGIMFGSLLFGFLSDRFGRRPVILVSYVTTLTFAVLSAFSISYIMFTIMRFLTGVSLAGINIISIVLNIEWFNIEKRTVSGVVQGLDWIVGTWILVGIAYWSNNWRVLILIVTSPLILSIMTWRWLPESARWLLANGKADAAHHYIMKCADMNNRSKYMATITPTTLLESVEAKTDVRKYTSLDLFRTPNMRKITICAGIVWAGVAFTYYGISLNITGFGLNPYLTQFLFATIELPSMVAVYFLLEKFGRRSSLAGTMIFTGLCLLINTFVSKDKWVIRSVVAVLGKASSVTSYTVVILYINELYPTVVRQNGLGFNAFVAQLAVAISPLIGLLEDIWHLLPSLTISAVAVGSGLVILLLPETLNARLPECIEDIEKPREQPARQGHPIKIASLDECDTETDQTVVKAKEKCKCHLLAVGNKLSIN